MRRRSRNYAKGRNAERLCAESIRMQETGWKCQQSCTDLGVQDTAGRHRKVLMAASVASMIGQFNMQNIWLLQELGYEVHVTCNFRKGNTCDRKQIRKLVKQLRDRKVILYQWDCPRDIHSLKRCRTAYRQILCLLRNHQYAWLHCHSPVGGALARMAAHAAGVPVMYTAHGFHFYQGAPLKNWLLYYPAERLLSNWTDLLITVNCEDACFAKKHLKAGKICDIPGVGIDPLRFRAQEDLQKCGKDRLSRQVCSRKDCRTRFREAYQIPQDACLLLSVGELSKRKNHRAVLVALTALVARGMHVCYLVCGQGAQKKQLERYVEKHGLKGHVWFPGFLERVEDAYQAADLFVFPSLQEGMPVALMEAMAAGMPCVVSDIRGNRELIADVRLRFAPDRPAQLKEILTALIEDPTRADACGQANRNIISAYSLENVQKRMVKIYCWMDHKYCSRITG